MTPTNRLTELRLKIDVLNGKAYLTPQLIAWYLDERKRFEALKKRFADRLHRARIRRLEAEFADLAASLDEAMDQVDPLLGPPDDPHWREKL